VQIADKGRAEIKDDQVYARLDFSDHIDDLRVVVAGREDGETVPCAERRRFEYPWHLVAADPTTQPMSDYGKRPLAMNGKTRFQETLGAPGGKTTMFPEAGPIARSPGGAGRSENCENFTVIIGQELHGGVL
jgi:hypothetical protein